jgi:hypothetical protein
MNLRTKGVFHSSNALVSLTGLLYAIVLWCLEKPPSDYGSPIHPWEPGTKTLHLLVAPLLVFGLGWIWHSHVQGQLRKKAPRKKASGLGLVALALPMVASGYAFQVAVEETWRQFWSQAHLWSGILWVLASLLHLDWIRGVWGGLRKVLRSFKIHLWAR